MQTETAPGTVMGTAGYMSPEQVRGEAVDHRSDIFSVGAVLHEMLTGRPAFARDTAADTMAAILKEEPIDLARTCPSRSRESSRAVWRKRARRAFSPRAIWRSPWRFCREPQRTARWPTTAAAGLAGVSFRGSPPERLPRPRPDPGDVGVVATHTGVIAAAPEHGAGTDVSLAALNAQFGDAAAISPDGSVLAFVGQKSDEGRPQIYVRRLNQLQAVPVSGTDDATALFFSPMGSGSVSSRPAP